MKRLSLVLLTLGCFISCSSVDKKNKELIHDFVKDIVISQNFDVGSWDKYFLLKKNNSSTEDAAKNEIIIAQLKALRQYLKKYNSEYEILGHKELGKQYVSNLQYENYNKVYYLIINDDIANPIIIEDGKIISFFYGLTKNRNKPNTNPWILN